MGRCLWVCMRSAPERTGLLQVWSLLLLGLSASTSADIYKCIHNDQVSFSNRPCVLGEAELYYRESEAERVRRQQREQAYQRELQAKALAQASQRMTDHVLDLMARGLEGEARHHAEENGLDYGQIQAAYQKALIDQQQREQQVLDAKMRQLARQQADLAEQQADIINQQEAMQSRQEAAERLRFWGVPHVIKPGRPVQLPHRHRPMPRRGGFSGKDPRTCVRPYGEGRPCAP
jgi:hypothetical protein